MSKSSRKRNHGRMAWRRRPAALPDRAFRPSPVDRLEDRTVPSPVVGGLHLLHDTGVSGSDGITTDPTIAGTVTNGGARVDGLTVQVDVNGDGQADGTTATDSAGAFVFDPSSLDLAPGTVHVSARAGAFDATQDATVYGAWTNLSFTLEAPDPPPVVASLGLLNDSGPRTA